MRCIIATIGLCLLGACASQPAKHSVPTIARVDPRLLEQTDEPAPAWAEQRAREYHQTTKYAARYTYFERTRLLAHGGFSARFRKYPAGQANVTYYFETSGRYMTHDAWICDGP